jgi:hypothetical protein
MDADTMVSKPADAVKAMSRSTPNPVSRQS